MRSQRVDQCTNDQRNVCSDDGTTVVGSSRSEFGEEAYVWTMDEGMMGLGDLPGGTFRSVAFAVSGDGKVVVGGSASARSVRLAKRFAGRLLKADWPLILCLASEW